MFLKRTFMRENELLASLRDLLATDDPSVLTGSGPDDCAHVRADGRRLSFSIDAFTEGSHFAADAPPRAVAEKALCASLSDLAGSACRARWALVTLSLKRGAGEGWAGEFARGLADAAREWGVAVVGGDTVSSPFSTTVTVAVAGEPLPGGPLLRGGAKKGDVLAVTGELGGSILGRHLRPTPRLREIDSLMHYCAARDEKHFPHAAMDISDGLALDLARLCRESGVGAIVDEDLIPVSDAARELARRTGKSPLDHALGDGEDFELLVAMPRRTWEMYGELREILPAGQVPFVRIGEATADGGVRIRRRDGAVVPLEPRGYEHQW